MTVAGTAIGLFVIAMTGLRAVPAGLPPSATTSRSSSTSRRCSRPVSRRPSCGSARDLGLRGNYLAVFLQLLMTPWLIILMKNFMRTVPYEIIESGKVDGAGDFRIFAPARACR